MNLAGLSFEALPPISIPFRFFLTAPLFALVGAGIIFFSGPDLWLSRWHPAVLALTHAFTLGFLASIMMGALMQILPVVAGIGFPKAGLIGTICHLGLVVGSVALIGNFLAPDNLYLVSAFLALSISFILYIGAACFVLVKKLSSGATITGIRIAVFSTLLTAGLGLFLLLRSAGLIDITADKLLTNIHAIWGIIGWAFILLIAVSYQIIPMFYVAPAFPLFIQSSATITMLILLILSTAAFVFKQHFSVILPIILFGLSLYSVSLLYVINKRKRKVPDTSIHYWQLAASGIILLTIFISIPTHWLPDVIQLKYSMLVTAFILYGVLISIVQSMLLKILPFLSYTHLQQRCLMDFNAMQYLPNMHELLAKKHAALLFKFHIASTIFLLLTIVNSAYYWLLSILITIEFCWLFYLMLKTVWIYRQAKHNMGLSGSLPENE